jgi:methyl-accepting chemotaxis protein
MNNLKLKFFLFFIGLGFIISLVMYIPYSNYIKHTYETTLTQVLRLVERHYPELSDPEAIWKKRCAGVDEYWNLTYAMNDIAQEFDITYIYYMRPTDNTFHYLFSSELTPQDITPENLFTAYEPDDIPEALQRAYDTRELSISPKPFTDAWGTFVSAYIPIFKNGAVVGVLGADYEVTKVRGFQRRAQIALLISILLAIAAALALTFNVSATLIVPIRKLERIAESLANMDFSVNIQKFKKDEIGDMQRALMRIRDNLHKAIDDLNVHLSTVTVNSNRLKTAIVESSEALGTIINNMDAMQGETDTQMKSVTHTSTSLEDIIKSIDILDNAVQTQAAHITQSSAAIEQMVANIASIRSVVVGVTKTTDTLSKSSAEGHSMLIKLAEAVKHIQEQSATLQNANKTIADIAGQTNILAMNAAIEAAHAGESGKGFAVVAGEIRKLAELSGKESNAISEEIKKIEQGIEQITGVSSQTVGAMDAIFTGIKSMDASFVQVTHAVEEQAAGGSQILTALKTIQDMTVQVRDGSGIIHRQSGSIHEEMTILQRISQNVVTRAYEVKTASGSIASFLENTKALVG